MASKIGWYKVLNQRMEVLMIAPASTIVDFFKVSLDDVDKAANTGKTLNMHLLYVEWHAEEWQVLGE